jgi:phosphopantothenate synthetase
MLRGIRPSRPSPAIAGTAVAEVATTARLDKKEKKKVKKIARKQANKQIDARLPFGTDDIADGAVNAAKIQNGSLGTGEFSSSIPTARVTRSANQSIPNGQTRSLGFDTERYDTANMHSGANISRLTAPATGIYEVSAQVDWAGNTAQRTMSLRKNGVTVIALDISPPGDTRPQEVSVQTRLRAGDFVEARVGHTSGSALNVVKLGEISPEFWMTWLTPGP